MHMPKHKHEHMHAHAHMHTCTRAHKHICTCMHTHAHACTCIHMHLPAAVEEEFVVLGASDIDEEAHGVLPLERAHVLAEARPAACRPLQTVTDRYRPYGRDVPEPTHRVCAMCASPATVCVRACSPYGQAGC